MRVRSCALALDDPKFPEGWQAVKLNLDDNGGLGHWRVQDKACPKCGKPLVLAPRDSHEKHKPSRETEGEVWISPARCLMCEEVVGRVEVHVVEMVSLFGEAEDARVHGGPWNVF